MTRAYDSLAEWFEYLNDDCDYPLWSQYFIRTLFSLSVGKNGLELGCGSGAFCRALAREGYRMAGADISPAMLSKASALAKEAGLEIPFYLADASKLKTLEKYDFILAPNDCYNYVQGEKLSSAFKKVASALKSGGIFWFDISSAYKLREKVANNMFADDREEVTYLSFNRLFEDRVEMDVTLFVKEGELFRRLDEQHVQYIHEEETLLSALEEAGFAILKVEGHLGAPKEGCERLHFICKKVASTKR